MAIGPEWFLLLKVDDRIWFDGFECFRINDISKLREDPYFLFVESALRKRKETMPETPRINVQNIEKVLVSAARTFPLVTLHIERRDPDVCYIGRVRGISKTEVSLLEIQPGAKWDITTTAYKLTDITGVSMGGDYEDALYIVGGEPPAG